LPAVVAADYVPSLAMIDSAAVPTKRWIRLAVPGDGERIGRIQVDSWRAAYVGLIPDAVLVGLSAEQRGAAWRGRLERPEAPERRCFVVEVDGAVLGFASTGPSRDQGADRGTAEVYALYLAPDAWGRGFGRVLFAAAVDDLGARGFSAVTLWVLGGNARARRFYEAAGMRPDGGAKVEVEGGAELPHLRYGLSVAPAAR
jgi:GNAT superfamily N-acetyltransferase